MKTIFKYRIVANGTKTPVTKLKRTLNGDVAWESVRTLLKDAAGYGNCRIELIERRTTGGDSLHQCVVDAETRASECAKETIELRGRVNALTARCHELTAERNEAQNMVEALSKQIDDMHAEKLQQDGVLKHTQKLLNDKSLPSDAEIAVAKEALEKARADRAALLGGKK